MDEIPQSTTQDLFGAIANPQTSEATITLIAAVVRQVLREEENMIPLRLGAREATPDPKPKRKKVPPVETFSARMEKTNVAFFKAYAKEHRLGSMRELFLRAEDALKLVTAQQPDRWDKAEKP